MADIVKMLLDDLGLYGTVPMTFPDLVIWIAVFVVAAALLAGTIKTCFIICREFAERMWKR